MVPINWNAIEIRYEECMPPLEYMSEHSLTEEEAKKQHEYLNKILNKNE